MFIARQKDLILLLCRTKEKWENSEVEGGENNGNDQLERKQARCSRELIPGLLDSGWKARLFTVKIGCRGFYRPHTKSWRFCV